MTNELKNFEAAQMAVNAAEQAGASARKLAKLWAVYFAAEDALKNVQGGW
jgi:hypothetical protein